MTVIEWDSEQMLLNEEYDLQVVQEADVRLDTTVL